MCGVGGKRWNTLEQFVRGNGAGGDGVFPKADSSGSGDGLRPGVIARVSAENGRSAAGRVPCSDGPRVAPHPSSANVGDHESSENRSESARSGSVRGRLASGSDIGSGNGGGSGEGSAGVSAARVLSGLASKQAVAAVGLSVAL